MRKFLLPLALVGVAGLTGCVGYGGGTYGSAYYSSGPAYGYGSGYGYGSSAVVIEQRPAYRYYGDRRDRDGDGVPNRYDARPDNPRRY
ncbi:hypothetical protein [Caenimonas aquaedulcis]|uniref:Lipoprotein n=1 Tax=Caenimonas aquaedulcis TaxID=2793270 RepID=A0A931H1V6_9BURK|nr:hypothetical protein [Caenimonas aquaedulcis]MBG9387027.1 hypothetical protein [Caenimonas aquaedulcis]